MKAAVYMGIENMPVKDVDYPSCPEGGLILKVMAVGICGGDVRTYYSGSHKIKPPMILGHEVAGEVVEICKDHHDYKIGDRLAMAPGIFCNNCYYCRHGMKTMCENLTEIAFQYQGGFAEYMPLPGKAFSNGRIVPIPQDISYEHAALAEPPSSCIYSQERANVSLGDTVVIIGAGPIGCIHIQVARARGVSKIIMVEISQGRLEKAKLFGADAYINGSREDAVKAVKGITNSLGADKVIVAAPSAIAQKEAIEMCKKRGTVVFFGGLPKDKPTAEINSNIIHYNDINIMGHYGQERHHVFQSLEMISKGQISAGKIINDILQLDEIVKGFELMSSKKALKVLIKPELK